MQGWEFFRTIFKEVGVYRRQLIFFSFLIIAGLIINYYWQKHTSAQVINEPSSTAALNNSLSNNLAVSVTKNGQVYINGEKNNQVLKFYDDYDELRILVYDKPGRFIDNFQAKIELPGPTKPSEIRQIVYAVHGAGESRAYMDNEKTLIYEVNNISPYAMVTIVAHLPKGLVTLSVVQKMTFQIQRLPLRIWFNVAIILPLLTIIFMVFMILQRRSGQIFKDKSVLDRPPDDLSLAIVGVLIDGNIGAREIAATLIDLARRGYLLIINKGEGEFSFGIRKGTNFESVQGLNSAERALLSKIFLPKAFKSTTDDIQMRIGRHIFSRKIAKFYLDTYNQATQLGFFVKNPGKVHLAYKYVGIGLFFISFICFLINAAVGADPKFSLVFWVGGMAAAAVTINLSPYMPARSPRGTQELKKWLAFRNYFSSSRKILAKEVIQSKFEEYLPYAIVFGVETDWMRLFAEEPFVKPGWYESQERVETIESFAGQFFPLIGYVAKDLAKSHEPTVE